MTGRPANFSRLTFAGPRSIVQVNRSKTSDVTTHEAVDAVVISRDKCSDDEKAQLYDNDCEPVSNRTFLSDNRPRNTEPVFQCRAICRDARHYDVETLRMRTSCGSCSTRNDTYVCERQSACHDECESSFSKTAGCVFTGSCRSMICLSGIDSKLPAVISVNDDAGLHGAIVSVDNDGAPVAKDPPVFMNYLGDVEVPNSTTVRADLDVNNDQSGSDKEEKGAEEKGAATESGEESAKESISKWIWLGPLVGLFGAVLTAFAAIGAAYITRHSSSVVVRVGNKNGLLPGNDADSEPTSKVSHDSKLRFHLFRPNPVV